MLLSLRIENFALIDQLELTFGTGLNVLTGETGAGKSIILDAIDAALGGKVSGRAIRTGEQRALLEATFELTPGLLQWLAQEEIDLVDETTLVCSREITAGQNSSPRSRSRLNGVLVNKQQMQQVRDRLIEITAQGQTVQLLQPNHQRDWLDHFGGLDLMEQRQQVATAYAATQKALTSLEKRRQFESQRLQQMDLFEYQGKELGEASLDDPAELEHLEQEQKRLSHGVELQQQSYQVYEGLYQNDSGGIAAADLIGQASRTLEAMVTVDREVQPMLDLVNEALAQIEEAGRQINAYGESLETDPERLHDVEARISQLKQICRKYGPTLADAIAHGQHIQAQLDQLSDGGQSVEDLEAVYAQTQAHLKTLCDRLTQLRQETAQALQARLIAALKPLAMEKIQFQVAIAPTMPNATGADAITYQFSPNPGEPLQPLNETASGGEMSRFLLALKACFSQIDPVGTLVFDEIDVGVSGRVAQAIAEKLHQLGQGHQVLCVTHQPIVAAMAENHFQVAKSVIETSDRPTKGKSSDPVQPPEERTVVRITRLTEQLRLEEIAQIASGKTDWEALNFAESLLSQAEQLRESHRQPTEQHPPQSTNVVVEKEQPAVAAKSSRKATSKSRNSQAKASRKAKNA